MTQPLVLSAFTATTALGVGQRAAAGGTAGRHFGPEAL